MAPKLDFKTSLAFIPPRRDAKSLQNTYNLRNNTTYLTLLKPKREFLKRTFKYSGTMLWNRLSNEAKTADPLYMFKKLY